MFSATTFLVSALQLDSDLSGIYFVVDLTWRYSYYFTFKWLNQMYQHHLQNNNYGLLRNLYASQEATVRTGHETTDWFQAAYCHPAYLTFMQSTSCEMPGRMKYKVESRLPGEISITSDM